MKSIKSKFLLIVISGLLIMTCAISTVTLLATNRILRTNANTILDTLCQKEAAQIDQVLDSVQNSVQIMEAYLLSELTDPEELRREDTRAFYTERIEEMFVNVAANTNGVVAFYLRYDPTLTDPTAGFFYDRSQDGSRLVEVPTTDLSAYSPDDFERVGWYYVPKEAGHPLWMSPYYNVNNHFLMISYVIPLYLDGTFIGVIGMDVDFLSLTQKVDSIPLYDNGMAVLYDSDSSVLHSHRNGSDSTHSAELQTEARAPLANGMELSLQANYRDIHKESYPLVGRILLIFAAILLFFIIAVTKLTSTVVDPLKKLTEATKQIANGNLDVRLDCCSSDEVGTLSRMVQQMSEKLKVSIEYINTLAYRDSLTGLRNRTSYNETVAALDEEMRQPDFRLAVLVADINGLKYVNDTYGHDLGNQMIIRAAQMICDTFTHSPVFRIGGDEFVVLLQHRDLDCLDTLIHTLDEACEREFIVVDGEQILVSVARGSSCFDPETDHCYDDIFRRADQAMYANKQQFKQRAGQRS